MAKEKHALVNTKVTVHNLVLRGWGVTLVDQNSSNLTLRKNYFVDYTPQNPLFSLCFRPYWNKLLQFWVKYPTVTWWKLRPNVGVSEQLECHTCRPKLKSNLFSYFSHSWCNSDIVVCQNHPVLDFDQIQGRK